MVVKHYTFVLSYLSFVCLNEFRPLLGVVSSKSTRNTSDAELQPRSRFRRIAVTFDPLDRGQSNLKLSYT